MFKKTINQILLRIDKYQQIIYSEISGAAEGGATKMLWWNMSLWRGEKIIPSPFYYLKNKAVNDCAFEKGRLSLLLFFRCCFYLRVRSDLRPFFLSLQSFFLNSLLTSALLL